MMILTCHCGQSSIKTNKRPEFVHECNCKLCRKSGARWAYFHPSDVMIDGSTSGYSREDKAEPVANIRFCSNCGSTTHFVLTESAIAKFGNSMMGINVRLADEEQLAGVELRYPDGASWSGAGEFGYVRPPIILGSKA